MFEEMTEQQAREEILKLTKEYCEKYHNNKNHTKRATVFHMRPVFMIQKNGKSCGQFSGILADSRTLHQ